MKRRITGLVLVLIMVLCLFPTTAMAGREATRNILILDGAGIYNTLWSSSIDSGMATGTNYYYIWDDTAKTVSTTTDMGNWNIRVYAVDASNVTMTLRNLHYSKNDANEWDAAFRIQALNITIVSAGSSNSIVATDAAAINCIGDWIGGNHIGSLTLTGSAQLTIGSSTARCRHGIKGTDRCSLTLSGANIIVYDKMDGLKSEGGDITIDNSTVVIYDEGYNSVPDCGEKCAIHADKHYDSESIYGNVTIRNGSTVTAQSKDAYAIYAAGSINISGSMITAFTQNKDRAATATSITVTAPTGKVVKVGSSASDAVEGTYDTNTVQKYFSIGSAQSSFDPSVPIPVAGIVYDKVESAKTADAGVLLYGALAMSSLLGTGIVIGKRKEF